MAASASGNQRVGLWSIAKGMLAAGSGGLSPLRGLARLAHNQIITNDTLADQIQRHAQRRPQALALSFEGRQWRYGEFDSWINQTAHALQQQGVVAGDCIGILAGNRPEVLVAVAALVRLGAIAGMLNPNLKTEALVHASRTMKLRGLILSADFVELARQAELDQLDLRCSWPAEADSRHTPDLGSDWNDLEQLRMQLPRERPAPPENPAAYCYYILTSGTTGLPKASKMSHRRWIQAMAGLGLMALRLRADDIFYCALPLYHNNALTVSWGAVLGAGAELVLERKFSSSQFWPRIQASGATVFCYIGELCRYLLAQPPSPDEQGHQLRAAIGNGLRPELWNRFKQRFGIAHVCEFYGASEGNLVFVNGFNAERTAGFCPYPYAIVECDIDTAAPLRDANGQLQRVAAGRSGLLLTKVSDATPFDGYTDEQASESKLIRDGFKPGDCWFNTGDLVCNQGLRHIQFVDRLGDTFRWKGENVATTEVEAALREVAGVEDCSVYGAQLPGQDGRAGMAAVVAPASVLESEALTQALRASLPAYSVPLFLRRVTELESTATFKKRKQELRDQGADPAQTQDSLFVLLPEARHFQPLDSSLWQAICTGSQRI